MSTDRQLIYGSTADRMARTPLIGQIGTDTDLKRVITGDGAKAGGYVMAGEEDLDRFNGTGAMFVFEGDSIPFGFNTTNPATNCYPYLFMQKKFASRAIGYHNFAATGTLVAGMASRYNANVKPLRPAANGGAGGRKAYLFIHCGINDLATNAVAINVVNALVDYIAQAKADGFTVVLITILPVRTSNSLALEPGRIIVNAYIRDGYMAADIVTDLAYVLGNADDGNMTLDGTHPTDGAHVIAANYLELGMKSGGFVIGGALRKTEETNFDRRQLGPGSLTAAVSSVLMALPTSGNLFSLNMRVLPGTNGPIGFDMSFDGGATFLQATGAYFWYGHQMIASSFTPVNSSSTYGWLLGASAYSGFGSVAHMCRALFSPGDGIAGPSLDADFYSTDSAGPGFNVGHVNTRVNSIPGRATHLRIISSMSTSIAAGSFISLKKEG